MNDSSLISEAEELQELLEWLSKTSITMGDPIQRCNPSSNILLNSIAFWLVTQPASPEELEKRQQQICRLATLLPELVKRIKEPTIKLATPEFFECDRCHELVFTLDRSSSLCENCEERRERERDG